MSYCKEFGKDKVMFITKEDHAIPSTIELPQSEQAPGLILASGEINWNCPCLGGMATGPCGVEFRDAFSCFHYSEETAKGSDCYDAFKTMQECFTKYPGVYNKNDDDNDDFDNVINSSAEAAAETKPSNSNAVDTAEVTDEIKVNEVHGKSSIAAK